METGTSSRHAMCYTGTVMQQGQPPCSLPVSRGTVDRKQETLGQPPGYDSPLVKQKQNSVQTVHWIMVTGVTWPPWGWWLSEAVVGGWASGYISWRHRNASGKVGGSVHLTLLSRHKMWMHRYENCVNWIAHLEYLQRWEVALNLIQNLYEKVAFPSTKIAVPGSYLGMTCTRTVHELDNTSLLS